ncbi:MAG: glycoside hydrolase family 16 protein [Tannerellaceae bacterium]|nr:glycoside hydrolase family 16 protein [Tannerellaceae bacterium]
MKNTIIYLALLLALPVVGQSLYPPTSEGLPAGMKLVWHDEFNEASLDTTKWFTQYYSIFDFVAQVNYTDFRNNTLPEPGIEFTGSSLILRTDEFVPDRPFMANGRKISSVQTYDWNSNRHKLDNRRGGYIEARIRRNATSDAGQVNGAFWLDSPGPDARYFVEKGETAFGVQGIRPRGQVFEIDLCEYITTEIVLHGNVSPEGEFQRNIGHHIVEGNFMNQWTTHGILWSPAGLKFYVDGKLVREWWDPHDIKSPNHTMNVLIGAYGNGGTVTVEADYVRYYSWELQEGNELPNPGFEYHAGLFPWEGEGTVLKEAARSGSYGVSLKPGEAIFQYVYLDHTCEYECSFWGKGTTAMEVRIDNIQQVSGLSEDTTTALFELSGGFSQKKLTFRTLPEYGDHCRTVKIILRNTGTDILELDDIEIRKHQQKQ